MDSPVLGNRKSIIYRQMREAHFRSSDCSISHSMQTPRILVCHHCPGVTVLKFYFWHGACFYCSGRTLGTPPPRHGLVLSPFSWPRFHKVLCQYSPEPGRRRDKIWGGLARWSAREFQVKILLLDTVHGEILKSRQERSCPFKRGSSMGCREKSSSEHLSDKVTL